MINSKLVKKLESIDTVRIKSRVSVREFEKPLREKAEEYGIPLRVTYDQIKSGGLLNSATTDCICLFQPNHERDYFKFIIYVESTGNLSDVRFGYTGTSQASKDLAMYEYNKKKGSLSGMAFNSIKNVVKGSAQKEKDENQYYSIINDILNETIEKVFEF